MTVRGVRCVTGLCQVHTQEENAGDGCQEWTDCQLLTQEDQEVADTEGDGDGQPRPGAAVLL